MAVDINGDGLIALGGTSTTQGRLRLAEDTDNGTNYIELTAPASVASNRTMTFPDETGTVLSSVSAITAFPSTVGYRNIPPVGTQTGSYTLTTADVGEYVQVGSGGSITIPNATFAEGDAISIFNNTSGNITITCTITTAYIAGTDSDKASVTLATRGVCTILFISSTVCVISGNVS
jgi:hypothetical protein